MNQKEVKEEKIATSAQCATFASMIAVELTKEFEGKLNFDHVQSFITDQNQEVVKLFAERFAIEIFNIVTGITSFRMIDRNGCTIHFCQNCSGVFRAKIHDPRDDHDIHDYNPTTGRLISDEDNEAHKDDI